MITTNNELRKGKLAARVGWKLTELKSKVIAWWKLGKPVWISLGVGWLWVGFSWVIGWELPASGAMLVCGALISDFMFTEMNWRRIAGNIGNKLIYKSLMQLSDAEDNEYPIKECYLSSESNKGYGGGVREIDLVRSVSPSNTKEKFKIGTVEEDCFWIARGKNYVEWRIICSIVFSAIAGTVIWGYGHLLSPMCSCCY